MILRPSSDTLMWLLGCRALSNCIRKATNADSRRVKAVHVVFVCTLIGACMAAHRSHGRPQHGNVSTSTFRQACAHYAAPDSIALTNMQRPELTQDQNLSSEQWRMKKLPQKTAVRELLSVLRFFGEQGKMVWAAHLA